MNQEFAKKDKEFRVESLRVIHIKVCEIVCVGLVHAHNNLFQFSNLWVVYMLEVQVREEKFQIVIDWIVDLFLFLRVVSMVNQVYQ